MSRFTLSLVCLLFAAELFAGRHVGFQTDAFNRIYPATYDKTMVFSPMSFELDCVLLAESLETIPKAQVSEMMGVVMNFEETYAPVLNACESRTNGVSLIAARGFCVPDVRKANPIFRLFLMHTYGAEVMPLSPSLGTESWFRAAMEGEMEDFEIPPSSQRSSGFSLYDLVSVRVCWEQPFPLENTRTLDFHPALGADPVRMEFMSDIRRADTWEGPDYTLLRLPLKGDAFFYAVLPREGGDLSPIRQDISSASIDRLLAVTKSITDPAVDHGPCVIVLPRLDLASRADVQSALRYFRIPMRGLEQVAPGCSAHEISQRVRFRLDEHGPGQQPLVRKNAEDVVALTPTSRRLVFNRPFFFFVYHEPSATIPVSGQYSGPQGK